PLITFIDTPGAYPGVGSEERGQSEAIARNLFEMSCMGVPIISCVIGEGGSGGALAIGVCDRLLMLQFSTYSVISPEGCASILWKSADKKEVAADAMNLTADRLSKLKLVDEVLPEPVGGAHRNPQATADSIKSALVRGRRRFASLRLLHIDHGLQAASADWAKHCARQARRWHVPFVALRATIRKKKGDSPEAAARAARYALFERALEPGEVLVTA